MKRVRSADRLNEPEREDQDSPRDLERKKWGHVLDSVRELTHNE